ncbi:MAG: hypothetical protein M3160_00125 [Candidatus Eremiobacteraeota bacterium]|nr:hypothetical protein [Candidatus Eremiobacteraeota bacterium]
MTSRKNFLAAFASATAAMTLASRKGGAQPSPIPRASAPPAAVASPTASPPKPSEAALATAALMLAFDPKLSHSELRTIAGAIDSNRKEGRSLNKGKRRLSNSDEPVTTFRVPFR